MKKTIKLGIVLLSIFFMNDLGANVVDDAYEILSSDRILNVKSVDPDKFVERGFCDDFIDHNIEQCKYMLYNWTVRAYVNKVIGDMEINISSVCESKNTCDIYIGLPGGELISKTYSINYTGVYDEVKMEEAETYLESINYQNRIMDLLYINNIVNYSSKINELFWNNTHALRIFPGLKNTIEKNNEVNYALGFHGAGGGMYADGNNGAVFIEKDDTFYAAKEMIAYTEKLFIVPSTVENNISATEEALKNRIENYLNRDDITVEIEYNSEADQTWFMNEDSEGNLINEINERMEYYFEDSEGISSRGAYNLSLVSDDETLDFQTEIFVVAVPQDKYNSLDVTIKSMDTINDIHISTNANNVPLDTTLETESVKNEDYVLNGINEKGTLMAAYDINLYSIINDEYIRTIDSGVEVMFPIDNSYNKETIKIYHVKKDGTTGEEYIANVIILDGKKYAKFTTNHFSTYVAVIETSNNPKTSDNIIIYLLISIISLFIVCNKSKIKEI